jgi:iron-sulfur cluster repair protein YtfE (RIC family)
MSSADPIRDLAHAHADLNRRVLELAAMIRGRHLGREPALVEMLSELRENLFLHFAREEEGFFPFVAEHMPELAERVNAMAVAHDAICGALARMCHMAASEAPPATLSAVFERFESAYAGHASSEAELLRSLEGRVDADQRTQLAALVRGL